MGESRVDHVGGATLVTTCDGDDPYTSTNRMVVTFAPGLLLEDVMIVMVQEVPHDPQHLVCTIQRADAIDGEPSEDLPPEIEDAAMDWIHAYRDTFYPGSTDPEET